MVDTLVLYVHDTVFHRQLIQQLFKAVLGQGMSIKSQKLSVENDNEDIERKVDQFTYNRKYLHLMGNAETTDISYFHHLKSSHYELAYQINFHRDLIQFNFSVPKYLYGTNVLQFMPHYPEKEAARFADGMEHFSAINAEIGKTYSRLISFIKHFFLTEFGPGIVNYAKVEVARIDLCYNQVFDTESQALDYLQECKLIRKKYQRDSSDVLASSEYGTDKERITEDEHQDYTKSVFRKNERYSFKIYHKGSEYKKNDIHQHRKLNREYNYRERNGKNENEGLFDTHILQQIADRTLRYEATFRGTYLSYIFHQKVFRSRRNKQWSVFYKEYKKIKALINSKPTNPKKDEKGNIIIKDGHYINQNTFELLTKEQRKRYNYCSNILSKTFHFFLDTMPSDQAFQTVYEATEEELNIKNYKKVYVSTYAKFSEHLFKEVAAKFVSFIEEFYIKEKRSSKSVYELIEHDNNNKAKQHKKDTASMSSIKSFLKVWELCGCNFDEIIKQELYSRATVYRYKAMLKKYGIDGRNVRNRNSNYVAMWDFTRYDYWVQLNYAKLHTLKGAARF